MNELVKIVEDLRKDLLEQEDTVARLNGVDRNEMDIGDDNSKT